MKPGVIFAAVLFVAACRQQPQTGNQTAQGVAPPAYDFQTIRKNEPGLTDFCIQHFLKGDGSYVPDERCFKLGRPERMRGTWGAAFEGSQFCPDSWKECPQTDKAPRAHIWLAFAEQLNFDVKTYIGGFYAIDFIGRRTIHPGHYGQMGSFSQEVIVDRIISLKEIKPPPK